MSFPNVSSSQVNRGEPSTSWGFPTVGDSSPLGKPSDGPLPQAQTGDSQQNSHSVRVEIERLREDWLASKALSTEATYRFVFDEFVAWAAPLGVNVLTARRGDLDRYRRWLRNPHRARGVQEETTVAKKLSALSSFYRYAIADPDNDLFEHSPTTHVDRPSVENISHREGLTAAEARRMMALSLEAKTTLDGALVHLLLSTGMRVSEACSADVSALGRDSGARIITVRRKGGKRARLPLSAACCRALDAHVAGRGTGPLLLTQRGRLSRYQAFRIVQALAAVVAPGRDVGPHSLRHTAATLAILEGVALYKVQEMLGHRDLRTTMRYFHAVESIQESAVHVLAAVLAAEVDD